MSLVKIVYDAKESERERFGESKSFVKLLPRRYIVFLLIVKLNVHKDLTQLFQVNLVPLISSYNPKVLYS
jgi:hypothetical protein